MSLLRNAGVCLLAGTLTLTLMGCAGTEASSVRDDTHEPPGMSAQDSAFFDISALDLDFSKRDRDADYDEAAATKVTFSDSGVQIDGTGAAAEGQAVTLSQEGTYVVSGTANQGQLVVDAGDEDKIQVVLANAQIHNASGPALYVNNADKCFITLAEGTDNSLSDGQSYELASEDDNRDAAVFSRDDLTINGAGSLTVTGSYQHAICSKDDLVIAGGTLRISAKEDAFQGKDCIKMAEGAVTVNAGDDAFHSDGYLYVQNGTVSVESCYEGYEGEQIIIDGGSHAIIASDDALNAALSEEGGTATPTDAGGPADMAPSSSDCLIQINGGSLNLSGGNDGIDSNGNVLIEGGTVLVSGPDAGMDGSLDYDLSAQINGGCVLMTGAVGSTRGLDESEQSVTYGQAQGSQGEEVSLMDAEGEVLASLVASCDFSTVLASSPQISEGDAFFIQCGSERMELTMGSIAEGAFGGPEVGGGGRDMALPDGSPADMPEALEAPDGNAPEKVGGSGNAGAPPSGKEAPGLADSRRGR